MSASTNIARRAAFLGNARAMSALTLPPPTLGRYARHLPRKTSAIAILIPLRHLGTDHHTQSQSQSAPPPGFNVEQAKKPLPKENTSAAKTDQKSKDSNSKTANNEGAQAVSKDSVKGVKADSDASLTDLANAKQAAVDNKKDGQKDKKTLWQKIKHEVQHYWDGTKLLAVEVKISTRLAVKMAAGYELSRRENRQLKRTVQDLGRLIPFSVFIIVPFAELLLPVALKLFPNLLPSTYEAQKSKDAKATTLRTTRKEVSDFLRRSLKETGLPVTPATIQREEFTTFFRKLRSSAETPTDDDVIKACQIFKDDLTLDNLSRPQLVSICRYMNLNTFGTDNMLRYQIRHRMKQIKRDDRQISYEGVDSLTSGELQMACASRGIRTQSVSPARMREYLQQWLDLRLTDRVPSTLLVLSNAYMYGQGAGGSTSQIDALVGVLSSIPDELLHEIALEVHTAEGAATNKQRLEVLKEQEDLIEEENDQNQENAITGLATPRDVEDIDDKDETHVPVEAKSVGADAVREAEEAEQEAVAAKRQQQADMEQKKP
ncbi:LETM1-domain-containing protein [Sodiomyces alkalinus F11]|uniref:LETM1-domain-containing protein n=1 Tax=Sodiomyces alkalinus (strain CBS 110278 / VKM F-3762 / F11) TaxID=1314773 RepID=A0A3N2PXY1_SODAK|nr:LETM1-domain-containing protein [Sodiomyces alkalinus F11]ROT39342.1 LETM1-domain-containing protein [Sodiomyces alkalinus F11]